MTSLAERKCRHHEFNFVKSTLFEIAKSANVLLLLEAVEILQAVSKVDTKLVMNFDYTSIDVHVLFRKEPFMTKPWFAEQWLVCLSMCLAYCTKRFPQSAEFRLKYNWL